MADISETKARLNAAIAQSLEGLVEYTEQDAIQRVYSYFDALINERKPASLPNNIIANFDRYMVRIKQNWAKQHGVVPNHPEPKPKVNSEGRKTGDATKV